MENSRLENLLRLKGINAQGFGTIPKLVMRDKRVSIEAKSIYSYISAFAGNGTTSFPSVEIMINELNISEARFYRHRKILIDLNYIEITRERKAGRWGRNIYELVQIPIPLIDTSVLNGDESEDSPIEETTEQAQSLPEDIDGYDTNELIQICFENIEQELKDYLQYCINLSPRHKDCSKDVAHTIGLAMLIAKSSGLKFNKRIYKEDELKQIFNLLKESDMSSIFNSIAFVDMQQKCRYILGCIFNKTIRGKQNE